MRFVNLDGTEVMAFDASTQGGSFVFLGTRGPAAIYLETEMAQYDHIRTLKLLHRDGSVEVLRSFGTRNLDSIVLSPDGSQWLWSDHIRTGDVIHSVLYLGSDTGDRVIASLDATPSTGMGSFEFIAAYRWDAGGAIVAHDLALDWGPIVVPMGTGAHGDVYLLDAKSGTLTPLWQGSVLTAGSCVFHARAADGTIACVVPDSGVLKIGKPPEPSISIGLGQTLAGAKAGSISFKPGPVSLLAIGRYATTLNTGYPITFQTDIADVRTGQIKPFGPRGLVPGSSAWAWLADGSLVEFRPPAGNMATEPYVTYVISPDGVARQVAIGQPVGVWA